MLHISTDLKDTQWLRYILEEFARINRAEFPIQIVSAKPGKGISNVINYGSNPSGDISIPDRSHITPDGKTRRLSEDVHVLNDTTVQDKGYTVPYDLFWNAFVFLSRLEECLSEKRGGKIRSYSFNHPRLDKTTFDIPVVNYLFDELEQLIRKHFPDLPFGDSHNPIIEYSHDVDYIRKTVQLRLKQTLFNGFNTCKHILTPLSFSKQFAQTISFSLSNTPCWCFDYWEELEKRAGIRSVFYVYAKTGKKDLKSWLLDPSYDITTHVRLKKKLRYLIQEGFEVGLHGSFDSATDEERLSQEKATLEDAIGTQVHKVRQHWLRYEEGTTPYIHNNLFEYDSTLGWNDRMGFRSGIAARYRPYDHHNQKPFDYMVTPQVIMDANIYEYGVQDIARLTRRTMEIVTGCRHFKTPHISLSWHQRVCNSDYGWHGLYEQILPHREDEAVRNRYSSLPIPLAM